MNADRADFRGSEEVILSGAKDLAARKILRFAQNDATRSAWIR
jgi:hypothetical protein